MASDLEWDGEKIKETVTEATTKHSPKDIINGLNNIRGQMKMMEENVEKFKSQTKINDSNLVKAKEDEKRLAVFEVKCIEIQKKHMAEIINLSKAEYTEKARKEADAMVAKDPNAYDERQIKQLPYLIYQKSLATDPKMSEKISASLINQYLYQEPIFENPFK